MAKFYQFGGFSERCGGCDMVRMVNYFGRERLCRDCMGAAFLTETEGEAIRMCKRDGSTIFVTREDRTQYRYGVPAGQWSAMVALRDRGLVSLQKSFTKGVWVLYLTPAGQNAIDLNPTAEEVAASNRIVSVTKWNGWV